MRQELDKLRAGLRTRDPAICGTAPAWIIQQVTARFDEMLASLTPVNERAQIEEFAQGAIRYIDDQCGSGCDTLGDALFALVSNKHR